MIDSVFVIIAIFLAAGVGYLFPRDEARRLRQRLFFAERTENEATRELACFRQKVRDSQAKQDQTVRTERALAIWAEQVKASDVLTRGPYRVQKWIDGQWVSLVPDRVRAALAGEVQ